MERILDKVNAAGALFPAVVIAAVAVAMVVVAFGMESVAPGVHDLFHDFRHAIGMPCH